MYPNFLELMLGSVLKIKLCKGISLLIILLLQQTSAQNSEEVIWKLEEQKNFSVLPINASGTYRVEDYIFKVVWDKKLSFSKNLGYYGGITSLKIFENGDLLFERRNIEDAVGLGEIAISFYDFNLDGHLDFKIPVGCAKNCDYKYYLFDAENSSFCHATDWDYIRIFKICSSTQQLISQPQGNAFDGLKKRFKIDRFSLYYLEEF